MVKTFVYFGGLLGLIFVRDSQMPTEQREMDIYRSLYLSRTLVRSTAYAIIYSFERGIGLCGSQAFASESRIV